MTQNTSWLCYNTVTQKSCFGPVDNMYLLCGIVHAHVRAERTNLFFDRDMIGALYKK